MDVPTMGFGQRLKAHPYEQTGYLVAGHIRLRIGPRRFIAAANTVEVVPSGKYWNS